LRWLVYCRMWPVGRSRRRKGCPVGRRDEDAALPGRASASWSVRNCVAGAGGRARHHSLRAPVKASIGGEHPSTIGHSCGTIRWPYFSLTRRKIPCPWCIGTRQQQEELSEENTRTQGLSRQRRTRCRCGQQFYGEKGCHCLIKVTVDRVI